MKVKVGVSNRHIHLSCDDYKLLFGDIPVEIKKNLNQPNEFASMQTVTIKGEKGSIDNVRFLGPFRNYTQVEVSKTDSYKLGVSPKVLTSGQLEEAVDITIIGPCGEIRRKSCIIANRHIHVDKEIRQKYGLENVSQVKVLIKTEKGGIMDNVYLKDSPKAYFEMHIDTDDANAFLLKQDDMVDIIF